MTTWMNETLATAAAPGRAGRTAAALRALDVALAGALWLPLALPLWWARSQGHTNDHAAAGRHGVPFQRLGLRLPAGRAGRWLGALGVSQWPVLINILQGDMAFVGPRARGPGEPVPAATTAVRPGLVNPWYIRQRTAVDFGSEPQADAQYLAQRGLRHDLGLLLRGIAVSLLPPPAAAVPGRVQVGDVAFDNVDMNEALARLRDMLDGGPAQQVSFVNPACVNIAARHRGYRRVLARAGLVLPDGIGIKIGGALLGTPLKQNVNGTDLFPRLCEMLQARSSSVFLLGGQPGVAEGVAAQIARLWPGLRVAGLRHGYFSAAEEGQVVAQVRTSGADLLLVARGVPSQDLFIHRHLPLLGVQVAMGVGGLFDFAAGRIARAPVWMRETGLEWVYRLLQEPSRMWRRYLVGNFTFLARMALQRVGLRRTAADALPVPRCEVATPQGEGLRTVLFATTRAPADLPVAADYPAALLPLGCQTLIEHVLDQLAKAAIIDLDVVLCDQPEALRVTLGDGSRWGMRIRWHLARDPNRPYAFLQSPSLQGARRILVGHAHALLGAPALLRLAGVDEMPTSVCPQAGVRWLGWASTAPARLAAIGPDLDEAGLGRALQGHALPVTLAERGAAVTVTSAEQLLQVSFGGAGDRLGTKGPAAWIRRPWGLMSPGALVHPQASLVGPVVVGPGCIVEADARVGPDVVLSRDVVVSGGTRIDRSVVLAHTYIGADLELSGTVVHGYRIRHVRLGVEAAPAATDALLADLAPTNGAETFLAARGLALLALLPASPALALHVAWRALTGRAPDWTLRSVVTGRDAVTQKLQMTRLRCPRQPDGFQPSGWVTLVGLLDVAAGKRRWVGLRPRSRSQWYALPAEWQDILAGERVGLLHAPAWAAEASLHQEACAAADVYLTVQSGLGRLRSVVLGMGLRNARHALSLT